jgi:hypothetical protein
LLVLVIAGAALLYPVKSTWPIGIEEWKGADGNRLLAASLSFPLVVFGGLLIAGGAWMAIVEWRGRFKKPEVATDAVDVGKVIEAIGKLRGAALLLVVGGLLLFGAAWIAQSAAKPTPASTSTGTSGGTTTTTTPP